MSQAKPEISGSMVFTEVKADDDFGIASLELVYAVRGGQERVVPFNRTGSGLTINGERTVYLEDLGVQPGDRVRVLP